MRISPVYNISLLNQIRDAERISYDDLWAKNSDMVKRIFDDELETLKKMGYIRIEDDICIFVTRY